ncbi:vesicle-associated membrane protein-associated protein A-like isoform X2 [Corticium candelabrum]|uniref:vesicle-associated membrane protein-associated protein A-like isoform X2 n=1 Tax=Corticium candelabrum TaxID=121492 RepID=UPI002E26282D|nr:vesicle-associated membrane protein-associated protein A-like isoform X2 [Corticium candelabrum]
MSRDQLVRINPPTELKFQGPFTETKTVVLTLENIKDAPVCFKVKTTAPKQYCVRPNSGVVEPHSSAGVQIMLQPFDYSSAKVSKHKFMVQTMYKPQNYVDSESVVADCCLCKCSDFEGSCSYTTIDACYNCTVSRHYGDCELC